MLFIAIAESVQTKKNRYRSRADFDEGDFRLMLPRFSEENFPKNLVVTDKIKAIADKYGATPSQVTLAWILAEHDTSKLSCCTVYPGMPLTLSSSLFSLSLTVVPIPGCRTVERIEENAKGAELTLSAGSISSDFLFCAFRLASRMSSPSCTWE